MFQKLMFFLCALAAGFAAEQQSNDIVILGGGISGLSSGIYLARSGFKPLIIEGQNGSLISKTDSVENWPAEKNISGEKLIGKLKEQALFSGCTILEKEAVQADFSKRPFSIKLKDLISGSMQTVLTDSCLIATGCKSRLLNVEGEEQYRNRGVSYCALCDGALYKDRTVAVVGGGKAAVIESLYLSNLAKKVYVILRSENFRSSVEPANKKALLAKENVQVLYNSAVEKIKGDGSKVQKLQLKNGKELQIDGLFAAIGLVPNSSLFKGQIALDGQGFIKVDENQKTSLNGVFAAGDVTCSSVKQAILASAAGVKAALGLEHSLFLEKAEKQSRQSKALAQKPNAKQTEEPQLFKPVLQSEVGPLSEASSKTAGQKVAKNPPVRASKAQIFPAEEKKQLHEAKKVTVVEIRSKTQMEEELKNSRLPVIVDFYASWCGPCQKIAPLLENLPADKVKVLKVNVDNCQELAREYKIMAMPTAILFSSEGEVVSTKIGVLEINSLIGEFAN